MSLQERQRYDVRPRVNDYSVIIRFAPIVGLKGYIQIEDYTGPILHQLHIKGLLYISQKFISKRIKTGCSV